MLLEVGSKVGAYEITSRLGEGGMGVVFRARDSKLGRDVAIKALPEAFATDQDRLQRFLREAQALAALIIQTSLKSTVWMIPHNRHAL